MDTRENISCKDIENGEEMLDYLKTFCVRYNEKYFKERNSTYCSDNYDRFNLTYCKNKLNLSMSEKDKILINMKFDNHEEGLYFIKLYHDTWFLIRNEFSLDDSLNEELTDNVIDNLFEEFYSKCIKQLGTSN